MFRRVHVAHGLAISGVKACPAAWGSCWISVSDGPWWVVESCSWCAKVSSETEVMLKVSGQVLGFEYSLSRGQLS